MTFKKILKKLVRNPYVDLTAGTMLFISGLWETWETLPQDVADANFHSGHGVLIFGVVTMLKALTDMFAGLEFMDEAEFVEKKK